MKSAIIKIVIIILSLTFTIGFYFYQTQENLLFFPTRVAKGYSYETDSNHIEINIKTDDGIILNNLLVKTDSAKGLVVFLHGNAGSIADWSEENILYNDEDYDFLICDYRGFGKSGGEIDNQHRVFEDVLKVFDSVAKDYKDRKIVIIGYSLGTTFASYLASKRKVSMLVLLAPFYSLENMKSKMYPFIPTFLLKYRFQTFAYIDRISSPITIFHGVDDKIIPLKSSHRLKKHLKPEDRFINLPDQSHFGITNNDDYKAWIQKNLN